ncbi:hypothetical protein HMPREF1013_00841 [Bacillus sp. 2_A_57_CT2]|nr:hypothetical protein HMPREF1013_00841 [Bacillus sp. 2_A_57_CT2]
MIYMILMKAIKPVFLEGRIIEPGSTFSCNRDFAEKLKESKSAEPVVDDDSSPDDSMKPKTSKRKKANDSNEL